MKQNLREEHMKQKLVITFDEKTTAKYLELASGKTTDEVNADCCPSGASIRIDIGGPWGCSASFLSGNRNIEIGDVDVDLIDV